jgi:hypothetical protein
MMDNDFGYSGIITADLTVYGAEFWAACWKANGTNALIPFIEICTHEFAISIHHMRTLALTCKWFLGAVQRRLNWCNALRLKWGPVLAKKIVPYLVGRTHPFKYSGSRVEIIPINHDVGINQFGVRLLDIGVPIFSGAELASTTFAFANIGFFTRRPVAFAMVMYVACNPILVVDVNVEDYIDRGAESPSDIAAYRRKYGDRRDDWPGRYYVDLNLPTRFNPITLGQPFITPNRLCFNISPKYTIRDSAVGGHPDIEITLDVDFILANFTHSVVKFLTVGALEYDWDRYCLTYREPVNHHVWTTSLIRSRDDPNIIKAAQPGQPIPQQLHIDLNTAASNMTHEQAMANILAVQRAIYERMFGASFPHLQHAGPNVALDDLIQWSDDDSLRENDDSRGENNDQWAAGESPTQIHQDDAYESACTSTDEDV